MRELQGERGEGMSIETTHCLAFGGKGEGDMMTRAA